ncbi:MAG: hypothetical protein HY898_14385 [Deltaproteobacteria bacterium]|nr:hypothetical protein [Deltaproteobacteria bacterium]
MADTTQANATETRQAASGASPLVRIDELSLLLRRGAPEGLRFELKASRAMTAAHDPTLPVFEGWAQQAELVVRASGLCDAPFEVCLDFDGIRVGTTREASVVRTSSGHLHFSFELIVPLRSIAQHIGREVKVGVVMLPGARVLRLVKLSLPAIRAEGPTLTSLDLRDATDTVLFDAPERRLFDLQNPEEGLWVGTGRCKLRLLATWNKQGEGYTFDPRPGHVMHRWQRANDASDVLHEDPTRRVGGETTELELVFDSSHKGIGEIPPEGRDVPLDLIVEHALAFGNRSCIMSWLAPLPIRLRDPMPLLKTFQRLSAVGIDFGTTASVAALHHKGFRSLLRLGSPTSNTAENPTQLLIEDHEKLWAEMEAASATHRFPYLLDIVKGSHAAYDRMAEFPNAVVGELKSLPGRVMTLDQSPQLRDRDKQRDFLLDEGRVRILIRTYAYLLGRAINRPGQDVYLHYWLTHPAKYDRNIRVLLEEELKAGILLSIPEGISPEDVTVAMKASEPEAFAAEVCPELANLPALEPLVSKFGELRFAVFDFGGGTLDIACGRFRPATDQEQQESGSSTVVETLQVGGDEDLGGDYLTHELVWLTHQHDKFLPEMEEKEVPMMRPATVPSNNLANKAHLYKRSLAGRQNRVRFQRELGLEEIKFGPHKEPRRIEELTASRLDGTDVKLSSFKTDIPGLHGKLKAHLQTRIRDGVKLLNSMLRNTSWGTPGDWREQGVVILLAGNSSRSEFVEKALAEELGIPDLKVWRPGSTGKFQQVVLYEMPPRVERGVTIVGVTPKTATALGALKIANREVHLVRRAQGFSYFLGDLRGFPPKFVALIPMGAATANPSEFGAHYASFGTWDAQKPLRVAKDYVPGAMTSNDPRLSLIPTGLPPGSTGQLYVCVVSPEEVALYLEREGQEPLRTTLNLVKYMS